MKKFLSLSAASLVVAASLFSACSSPVSPQDRLTVNDARIDAVIAQMTLEV